MKRLTITAQADRELVMERIFKAPRQLVFDAYTKPEFIRRWLLGPDGWSMPVCEVDLRPGGKYRYVWRNDESGQEMGAGGVYREIDPPGRLVNTERFDDPWYPGEALLTTTFTEKDSTTELRVTILYESTEARDTVLNSPMESGVSASYERLDSILAELPA
ncbi:SRPBCC family protein [Flaviflagellibacter deserti]|uniref:SRPBCC family protein n=1 Tax=Flaviflagellibacter deserti TaxID=2267266 RepID=A0ABV9Z6M1_9HYPH